MPEAADGVGVFEERETFEYTGGNERTWFVERDGEVYAVRIADPNVGLF